eukprot:INCI19274.1.p1 GENE.INCI19274.1~~INCI19274.1.p1  ORF type:complete len:666 (-),score=87.79 INCI19274.1:94-1992(-)
MPGSSTRSASKFELFGSPESPNYRNTSNKNSSGDRYGRSRRFGAFSGSSATNSSGHNNSRSQPATVVASRYAHAAHASTFDDDLDDLFDDDDVSAIDAQSLRQRSSPSRRRRESPVRQGWQSGAGRGGRGGVASDSDDSFSSSDFDERGTTQNRADNGEGTYGEEGSSTSCSDPESDADSRSSGSAGGADGSAGGSTASGGGFQFFRPEQFTKFKSDNFIHRLKRLNAGEQVSSLRTTSSPGSAGTDEKRERHGGASPARMLSPRVRQASESSSRNRHGGSGPRSSASSVGSRRSAKNGLSSGRGFDSRSQGRQRGQASGSGYARRAKASSTAGSSRSGRMSSASSVTSAASSSRASRRATTKVYSSEVPPQIKKFNVKLVPAGAKPPSVQLSWTVPHHSGHPVSLFEVQQQVASEGIWTTLVSIRTKSSQGDSRDEHKRVHRFAVTDLREGVRLKYRIRAENKWGWGPYSAPSKALMVRPAKKTAASRNRNGAQRKKPITASRAVARPAESVSHGSGSDERHNPQRVEGGSGRGGGPAGGHGRKVKKITTTTTTVTVETDGESDLDDELFSGLVPARASSPKFASSPVASGASGVRKPAVSQSTHINNLEASLMKLDMRLQRVGSRSRGRQ